MEKEYVLVGRMQLKTRDYIKNLERENRILEHNWNELKKWLEEESKLDGTEGWHNCISETLSKMQELEEGGNNDNRT